jgi:predicted RNA-binding Zn ribbon-like protein
MIDPRPVTGEPLALDLANTEWGLGQRYRDYFADLEGVQVWLEEVGIPQGAASLEEIRAALLPVRQAIKTLLYTPENLPARAVLNHALALGRLGLTFGPQGVEETLEVADAARAGWLVARNYLELIANQADRIRKCANSKCVRYFLDTTRNHSRQWCSMQLCGAREKSKRHYQKRLGESVAPVAPVASTLKP